ncbi:MAG: excinuclease ABC subunit UvrC, partial [Thermoanaerobaculia bacterium]
VCSIEIDGGLPRPCLYHDMKRCLGPCVDGLTSSAEYADAVEAARLFLAGKTAPLTRSLRAQMESASESLEFERAARLRDMLQEIERQSVRSPLSSVHDEDLDLFGVAVHGNQASVSILVMRGGQVLDRREVFWEGEGAASPAQLLSELLPQIYDQTTFLPKELHLPFEVDGEEALADWMSERKGERVYLRHPERGPKAERLRIAAKDAEFAFRRRFRIDPARDAAPRALARHLGLAKPPRWIEGFDISNLQGTAVIASMVVWKDGRIRKGEYRSFNIRSFTGQDDFRSIAEAVGRRYRRLREESGVFPDLVMIDGGRGQLGAAAGALAELDLESLPLVALAKQEEELYLPGAPEPLRLPRRDEGLRLLQALRDEAHRFAVSKHRRQRTNASLRSRLEEIPGVGPERRKLLAKRFGTWETLAGASVEEVQGVLGESLGAAVHRFVGAATAESAEID